MKNCFYECGYSFCNEYEEVKDVYDLHIRIKDIDPCYVLLYNRVQKQFEVHKTNQLLSTFVCIVDKAMFNGGLLQYLRQTRVEFFDQQMKEIEEYNLQLEKQKIEQATEKASFVVKEAINFADKRGGDISKKDIRYIEKYTEE